MPGVYGSLTAPQNNLTYFSEPARKGGPQAQLRPGVHKKTL